MKNEVDKVFRDVKVSSKVIVVILLVLAVVLLVGIIDDGVHLDHLRQGCGVFVENKSTRSLRGIFMEGFTRVSQLCRTGRSRSRSVDFVGGGVGMVFDGCNIRGCSTFSSMNKGLDFTLTLLSGGGANLVLGTIRDHSGYFLCLGRVMGNRSCIMLDRRRIRTLEGTMGFNLNRVRGRWGATGDGGVFGAKKVSY